MSNLKISFCVFVFRLKKQFSHPEFVFAVILKQIWKESDHWARRYEFLKTGAFHEKMQTYCRKNFHEKGDENSKFQNFVFFEKSKFWNFEFPLTFSSIFRAKIEIVCPKKIDQNFPDFFRWKNVRRKKIGSSISIPNDPKIPKIILRSACDHYKIMNREHEEKVTFLYYLPSDPVLGEWGSWTFCTLSLRREETSLQSIVAISPTSDSSLFVPIMSANFVGRTVLEIP